jgi:hypothetical protein
MQGDMDDAGLTPGQPSPKKSRDRRKRRPKVRMLTTQDIDGRTFARALAERAKEGITQDLGGEEHLSTLERLMVEHAVWDAARLSDLNARWAMGEPVEATQIATVENAFNRTAVHQPTASSLATSRL